MEMFKECQGLVSVVSELTIGEEMYDLDSNNIGSYSGWHCF